MLRTFQVYGTLCKSMGSLPIQNNLLNVLKPWVDIWKGYSYRTIYLVNFNICIGVGSVRNDPKILLVLDTDSAADLHPPGDAYISQMLFHCGPHFSDSGS